MNHRDCNSTESLPTDLPYWPPHERLDAWQLQQARTSPDDRCDPDEAWGNAHVAD